MPYKILVTAPNLQSVLDRYRDLFEDKACELVVPQVNERMSVQELIPLVGDIDGAIVGDDAWGEEVLQQAPKLKVLSKWGTGIDSFDAKACAMHGVAIRNVPNAFSNAVADTVVGYMLMLGRELVLMNHDMKQGVWQKRLTKTLGEATLGVVGMGNIGKAVVRRAEAFDMTVLGTDPKPMPEAWLQQTRVSMVAMSELLAQSDYVSISCDLNETSYKLFGAAEFTAMKTSAFLINTARGDIVDEGALIAALQHGVISGAGLDVFEDEPLPKSSPLKKMDHVILGSHSANSSVAAYNHVHEQSIQNMFAVLEHTEMPAHA